MGQYFAIYLLLLLLALFIAWGIREWNGHIRNLRSIPNRIIVNGTRGKSSVTRLIAAGLQAGGYKVLAKTTGTKPQIIYSDRDEVPVIRLGPSNIREQISILKRAAREKMNTVVLENMSLRPDLQFIEESRIVQPNLVVITNIRSDHLDIMGPTLADIARAFINAVPRGSRIVTAEKELFDLMKDLAGRKSVTVIQSHEEDVDEKAMKKFPYFEHRENVALALEVCRLMEIGDQAAWQGLYRTRPDPGVLQDYELTIGGKHAVLHNALAANDPDSTYLIYERLGKPRKNFYILINCRDDRIDRSLQLAELIRERLPADAYFLCGRNTTPLLRRAQALGVARDKLDDLEGIGFAGIFQAIGRRIEDHATILAIGNIVGYGEQLINYLVAEGTR
jgi:poly-gamma-glutamate synthase PgsB/CapB